MKQTFKLSWALFALLALTIVTSCKKDKDDDVQEVTAGFTYQIDQTDPMTVHFTSTSVNQTSLSWEFGDGETSTETNPTHTYAAAGEYSVKLTATNSGGSDFVTQTINIVDANELQAILAGDTEKDWRLIRDVTTERYPLEVGPDEPAGTIWWAFGLNEALVVRPCMLNDTWKFKADGTLEFDDAGDYWAEGSVYPDDVDDMCAASTTMVNVDGIDVSAWSSGTHNWAIDGDQLTLTGTGAFIGLSKVATSSEVTVPQDEVTYTIEKLTEGSTDTLVVRTSYMAGETPAHWRFVLVHYDNPDDEPDIPQGTPPTANFTYSVDGMVATFTDASAEAQTYAWAFGDGETSTEASPTHTYATEGIYEVTLTVTNGAGSASVSGILLAPSTELTDAALQGTWVIAADAPKSVFVGPGLGMSNWWSVPVEFLSTGGANAGEDWTCMTDDEFIFSTGGVYEYKTNGSARNDGYMGPNEGVPSGCYTDEQIAASGNGAAFGSAIHSYELTSNGHQRIVLTNGAPYAAFIGFYKGYYGGENTNSANPPNGGNTTNTYDVMGYGTVNGAEYLLLSVDLDGDTPGGNGWSVLLTRPATN
ncbi:MAG TPA: PKD domain-containing protein [Lentimicrobium sp.]|nr:PKD domain-containing protein [Lentimicrobium sp.]